MRRRQPGELGAEGWLFDLHVEVERRDRHSLAHVEAVRSLPLHTRLQNDCGTVRCVRSPSQLSVDPSTVCLGQRIRCQVWALLTEHGEKLHREPRTPLKR